MNIDEGKGLSYYEHNIRVVLGGSPALAKQSLRPNKKNMCLG